MSLQLSSRPEGFAEFVGIVTASEAPAVLMLGRAWLRDLLAYLHRLERECRIAEQGTSEPSTFATLLFWDEQEFGYRRVLDFVRHRDARDEFLALHNPPLVIVECVRVGTEAIRP
jgi:hypothetical protein